MLNTQLDPNPLNKYSGIQATNTQEAVGYAVKSLESCVGAMIAVLVEATSLHVRTLSTPIDNSLKMELTNHLNVCSTASSTILDVIETSGSKLGSAMALETFDGNKDDLKPFTDFVDWIGREKKRVETMAASSGAVVPLEKEVYSPSPGADNTVIGGQTLHVEERQAPNNGFDL